jgi:hypothetical protein
MDISGLLSALDTIAPQKNAQDEVMDRHCSAFLTSKLNISNEVRINELNTFPELADNPKLITLKLLLYAQHKAGEPLLKGLACWIALQTLPLLNHIHKRSLRRTLQADLREATSQGTLQAIANVMFNVDIYVADHNEFQKATQDYAARNLQITELKNQTYLARHARMAGRGIAQTVAYGICLATVYFTLRSFFHF